MPDNIQELCGVTVPCLWYGFFRCFFSWSDEEIAAWSAPYEDDLLDSDSTINHDGWLEPVGLLLIPDEFLTDPNHGLVERLELFAKLGRAILGSPQHLPESVADWEAASERVSDVLAEYGMSLANVNRRCRRFNWRGRWVPVIVESDVG